MPPSADPRRDRHRAHRRPSHTMADQRLCSSPIRSEATVQDIQFAPRLSPRPQDPRRNALVYHRLEPGAYCLECGRVGSGDTPRRYVVVVSPPPCFVADVHTRGCCRSNGIKRHVPLSLAPVTAPVRHLGRERTRRDLRVGTRSYRLGVGAEKDERSLRGYRSRMSILNTADESQRCVSRPAEMSASPIGSTLFVYYRFALCVHEDSSRFARPRTLSLDFVPTRLLPLPLPLPILPLEPVVPLSFLSFLLYSWFTLAGSVMVHSVHFPSRSMSTS